MSDHFFFFFHVEKFSMAYIGDLKLISTDSGETPVPAPGYQLIPVDLNKGAGGKYIYLTYKRTDNLIEAITSISVVAGDTANYHIQGGHTKLTQDLSEGAGGMYIYITYIKGGENGYPPLVGLNVIFGNSRDIYPPDYWVRDNQNCNEGSGGDYIYICYILKKEEQVGK